MKLRRLLVSLPMVLLALATACATHDADDEELATSNAVAVTVTPARTGSIRAVVRAPGQVTPAAGAELAVTAPDRSRVAELPFAPGDRVRRGDVVARFDIPSLDAEVSARSSDLARAEARVATTKEAVGRLEGLYQRGIAARREVEEARRDLAEAQADVESAQGGIAAAKTVLARAVVTAPFDGVVLERTHNPGDLVEGGSEPVLRLLDPSRLQVEAAVAIGDLARVAIGQPAEIRGPGAAAPIAGSVTGLPASADAATGSARVRLAMQGQPTLPANASVEVEIFAAEHSAVVLIPAQAVIEESGRTFVYVVDDEKKAHRRAIETGIDSGHEVEVRSGVTAGENVIVAGQNALPDGATVTPRVDVGEAPASQTAAGQPVPPATATARPRPPPTPMGQP